MQSPGNDTKRRQGSSAQIVTYEQGPYLVRGAFELVGGDGEPIPARTVVALCGCGNSKAAPMCDGSHKMGRTRRPFTPPR